MSEVSADQTVELLKGFNDLYISRLLSGAAATLTIYDWMIVFDIEYQNIYQSRWTLPKALFYYIRLITPPGIIFGAFQLSDLRPALSTSFRLVSSYTFVEPNRSCRAWAVVTLFGMLSSLFASNGLLTLRLVALYKREKIMVWFIRIFFLASYVATLGLAISTLATLNNSIYYSDLLKVCSTTARSKTMSAIFYAPSTFEFLVFFLTAFRACQDAKLFTGASSAPFLVILYRDGIISFFVMACVRMWNVWIYTTGPSSSYNMGTPLMWAINTVLTTRVYMNLVWLAKKPLIESSEQEVTWGVTGGIRMRVHTITEIHTDTYSSRHWTGQRPRI